MYLRNGKTLSVFHFGKKSAALCVRTNGSPIKVASAQIFHRFILSSKRRRCHHKSKAFCKSSVGFLGEQKETASPWLVLIALRLKQRPRKTLGFQTPTSTLRANVA